MIDAAAMVMSGLGPDFSVGQIDELLDAGIRSFLLPGVMLAEPDRLYEAVTSIRSAAASHKAVRVCVALGPGKAGLPSPAFEPVPLGLAALGKSLAAHRAGKLLGMTASSAGIDLLFTPHLESVFNPKNESGVLDSFGENPESAARLSTAYINGIAAGGAAVCACGFPCSAIKGSSMAEPYPVVDAPLEILQGNGARPFSAAVRAGIEAVLVGRVLVPALEPDHIPAPSSLRIVQGRLRTVLKFDGLVIGEAADDEADPAAAAFGAVAAGCDLTIFMDIRKACAAARALSEGHTSLDPRKVRESGARMARILAGLPGAGNQSRLTALKKSFLSVKVGRDRRAGCVILRDNKDVFDGHGKPCFVLVFTPEPETVEPGLIDRFMRELRHALPGTEVLSSTADPDPEAAALVADSVVACASRRQSGASAAVLSCDAHFRPEQEALARIVEESFPLFSVIALRDPYDLAFFPKAGGLASVFGFSEASARDAAAILCGRLKTRAVMPLSVIGIGT